MWEQVRCGGSLYGVSSSSKGPPVAQKRKYVNKWVCAGEDAKGSPLPPLFPPFRRVGSRAFRPRHPFSRGLSSRALTGWACANWMTQVALRSSDFLLIMPILVARGCTRMRAPRKLQLSCWVHVQRCASRAALCVGNHGAYSHYNGLAPWLSPSYSPESFSACVCPTIWASSLGHRLALQATLQAGQECGGWERLM